MAANPGVPTPSLIFDTEKTPTETIVRCVGKITAETAALFQDTIRGLLPEAKCIVVDLTEVVYMDSAGLGALVAVWSSAKKKSAEVGFRWPEPQGPAAPYEIKLVNFNDYIRKLLRIVRLDKVFGIPDNSAKP